MVIGGTCGSQLVQHNIFACDQKAGTLFSELHSFLGQKETCALQLAAHDSATHVANWKTSKTNFSILMPLGDSGLTVLPLSST